MYTPINARVRKCIIPIPGDMEFMVSYPVQFSKHSLDLGEMCGFSYVDDNAKQQLSGSCLSRRLFKDTGYKKSQYVFRMQ